MPAPEPPALEPAKDYRERYQELIGPSLWECPVYHQAHMLVIEILPRSPHRKPATAIPHDEKDCFRMQIKLRRKSLAGPSDRSSAATWLIANFNCLAALAMLQNKPACAVFCRRTPTRLGVGGKVVPFAFAVLLKRLEKSHQSDSHA